MRAILATASLMLAGMILSSCGSAAVGSAGFIPGTATQNSAKIHAAQPLRGVITIGPHTGAQQHKVKPADSVGGGPPG